MEGFFITVMVVWSVLSLVLFFKIWGMTNNVSKILNILEEGSIRAKKSEIAELVQNGYKDSAEAKIEDFARKLSNAVFNREISAENAIMSYEFIERQYKELGLTMPDYVASIKGMI